MNSNSTRTFALTALVLGLALLLNSIWINFFVYALLLFASGIVIWTLEQYDHHHNP